MSATTTRFLSDLDKVLARGSAGGAEAFADRQVWALAEGGDRSKLQQVTRVGLTPDGAIVVLFRSPMSHGGLILPSSIR